jgi:CRISPR-associated protein (TIGR03986 family)
MFDNETIDFVNPYNFISLRKGIKKDISEYYPEGEELLTGKLTCKLIAKTPIIIPDAEKKRENANDYDEYPFMSINGEYVIPGSSIRGVIRSIYEALTDSCLFTNDDYHFSSRTNIAKKEKLLEKTEKGYALHNAVRYADREELAKDRESGDDIDFSSYTDSKGKKYVYNPNNLPKKEVEQSELKHGYVLRVNVFDNGDKISANSIFTLSEAGSVVRFEDDEKKKYIDAFADNLGKYVHYENEQFEHKDDDGKNKDGSENRYAQIYKDRFERMNVGDMLPVWCETRDGGFYLAPAQLSRNVYVNTPSALLMDELQPCENRSSVCPACALFGFVAAKYGSNDRAIGGRIRFTDAFASPNVSISRPMLLPPLLSPKTSSLEFYLRGGGDFFTADTPGVALAGRKFYWHHNEFKMPKSGEYKDSLTYCFEYAEKNSEFSFDVYFDNITREQLNQLFTALTLGENTEDGVHCQKFGHGKPLGFGSAKVVVTAAHRRIFSNGAYEPEKDIMGELEAVELPEELAIATDFNAVKGLTIDYPRIEGDIYEWFSDNRPMGGNNRLPRFKQKLPAATDKPPTLFGYSKASDIGTSGRVVGSSGKTDSVTSIDALLDSIKTGQSGNSAQSEGAKPKNAYAGLSSKEKRAFTSKNPGDSDKEVARQFINKCEKGIYDESICQAHLAQAKRLLGE